MTRRQGIARAGLRLLILLAVVLAGPSHAQSPAPAVSAPRTTDAAALGRLTLVAHLTDDGQRIDQGIVWRIFSEEGSSAKARLVATHREASPELRLAPGTYLVNAAFGRAHLTRKIVVKPGGPATEKFVLNAGGLKIDAALEGGGALAAGSVVYDILSDDRDQLGNRARIMTGARPGLIIRLNAGIYHVVSTYGDANATVQADVTVEAGKLSQATITHSAARVTFKLVARAGGHALADTQWTLQTPAGELVKESVGALPSHILAPGSYTVIAKTGSQAFRRDFSVQNGDVVQVEVVMQ